ncbi:Molybdopterin-synthase adenylyltransferase [hydrothermal vent metagenome]|uniref:Molybdopterin-synthase adenylyltransferase n=1 Tax=hydrothermal vent metagenome TaxID=652676 RepID=A0A3B0ZHQ9_9ZZZZ
MDDQQLERYSRHILLPEIDIAGQTRLLQSKILLIGAGGLGSPAAIYLASSGVGQITICDDDDVDLSNLQRQIAHSSERIGQNKADSARAALHTINPETTVIPIKQRLKGDMLLSAISDANIVLDASDNFPTRFMLNDACVKTHTPLVSGAAIRLSGQICVFRNHHSDTPCYRCLFDESTIADEENCAQSGVFAPLTGIIGSMMAAEALKLLVPFGKSLDSRLLTLNAATMDWRSLKLQKDPACPVCRSST